jgi:hypothetical protein
MKGVDGVRTGTAKAPLHGGHCPPWLFAKMKQLAAAVVQVIVYEYGAAEVLRRLSDPVWFQTFGSVLGFDWHSSGLTTVVCGALKDGLQEQQGELGLFFAGGKGKTSLKTPDEIIRAGERFGLDNNLSELTRTSRIVAKVDSAAVQDGYQLYHHFFIFDRQGNWAVVQQGMNEQERYARRYHWLSEGLTSFVSDPHHGVCGIPEDSVLNLVAADSQATRTASVELCMEKPERVVAIIKKLADAGSETLAAEPKLWDEPYPQLVMPAAHPVPSSTYLNKMLLKIYEKPPESYVGLLETQGVGPSTLRALAMVAEVTHGARPSFQDPVRYSFAHGGKDGYPFPVQRGDIENSLTVLRTAVEKAKLGDRDKLDSLRRLAQQENFLVTNSMRS